MRNTLDRFLEKAPDVYLLHCDMWGFPRAKNVINCGIGEANMVNIAAGLASQGKKVVIYGVAGFVIYKSYEQIKMNIKGWAEKKGSIVFCNAGANGCYSVCGRGHLIDDDKLLTRALGIPLIDPPDRKTFLRALVNGLKKPQCSFIRLGWDNEVWQT